MTSIFDAFISYGRADSKAFATRLESRLSQQGFNVWFDFNDIPLAVDFQDEIDDGIEKSQNFLFIISPHSVNSDYCRKEIELAIKLNKRIIPLLHVMKISRETWQKRNQNDTASEWEAYKAKGLHESYQNMHPTIRKLNWVYFQEGINDLEKSLADLIDLLRVHTDYVKQHTQLLVNALDWARNQKQTSYLLTGEEIQDALNWLDRRFQEEQSPCTPTDLHCEFITESIKNGNNLMTQVFLSYADEDRGTMEKLRNSLRRSGITVWTNTTDIKTGEVFTEAINQGIEQADNVVYLLSPDSIDSHYCQQEFNLAVKLNKRIIPVRVRETDRMQEPTALRDLHYIDLTDNVKEEDYRRDESELLKILLTDAPYYKEHKMLLTKALKWQRQQNNPSILLRGYNLRSAEAWLQVARTRTQHRPTPLQEEFIAESQRRPELESLDVFISYSRADSDLARKLNDALQIQGKMTWFDQESIAEGTDFAQEINNGIKACDNFLFILSPKSVKSPYCADEVEYAASLNKRFVTVLHREVNISDLHRELAKVEWLDFNRHQGDFNANFNQLVRTLDTDREHLRSHTKWLQRAWEWDQKQKSEDLLLRGSECAVARDWLLETEEQQKKPAATTLQKEFISASQKAIEAAEEAEERRQAEMLRLQEERTQEAEARLAEQKKSARRQRFLLGAVSVALVAAVGAGVEAFSLWQKSKTQQQNLEKVIEDQIKYMSRFSLGLTNSGRKFDALVESIRAGTLLKKLTQVKPEIKAPVLTGLQAAVYEEGFKEHNRLTKHETGLTSVAFSPDGQMIASVGWDGTVKLWNLEGKRLRNLKGHGSNVNIVAFSSDGQRIVSVSRDGTIKLWNLEGEELPSPPVDVGEVSTLAFSPDGKTIASVGKDGIIKLWNLEGQELSTRTIDVGEVSRLAFSPDGKTIVSASFDGTVKLLNLESQELKDLPMNVSEVISLAFSPDGKTIASGSRNGIIKLWNLEGQELPTRTMNADEVSSLAFSPDGKMIASAGKDRTIKIWNLQGQLRQTLKGHDDFVGSLAFSPDGKTIASASWDGTVRLWMKGKQLQILQRHNERIISIAFWPDGKTIASASMDGTIKLSDFEGQKLQTLSKPKGWFSHITLSPDGQTIATASYDGIIKLWNLEGKELSILPKHEGKVSSLAFSPDGKTIASGSSDGTVKLWNLQGQELLTLQGHKAWVTSIAFSPDGKMIASGSSDGTVKLWNLQGQLLKTFKGDEEAIDSVAFSPDGKTLASAGEDRTVKLWNFQGQLLHTLQGHEERVESVAFSPDGKTLASASIDGTVKLWNLEGQLWQTIQVSESGVKILAFSPDGKTLAVGSQHDSVIVLNLADLTLESLMQDACDWVEDYLKYNAPEEDRDLCDGY